MDSISDSTKFIASDNNNKNYMIIILSVLLILSLLGVNLLINQTKKELDIVINEPKADLSESPIQQGSAMKSNWCLVGEQNGRRGCVEVNDASKCMSGQVFPNANLCLNPTQTSNMLPNTKPQYHPLKSIKSNPDRSTW
jgi:hypothetical protein